MADISIESVAKVYDGGVRAVSDVNLDIADGEFVVLVGPSGCGKSTTLRMIAGLEEISEGQIKIAGRVVNDVHPKDRDIAMVFQNYALYPHMTVRANMAFALKLRKVPKAEIQRRVSEAARILDLEPYLDRKPKALSGGQRQRVAVGRAIVREPKAFLFDEPLSNLDAKLRVTTRAEIKALHRRLKTTTVYVTHDQEEAMTLGDRIVVMANGRVQQAGSPLEVFDRPANRFVAGFIGTPPMNFIEGQINESSHFTEIPAATGTTPIEPSAGGAPTSLALPAFPDPSRTPQPGEKVAFGIRPQAARHVDPNNADPACLIRGTIRIIEPLGEQMDVHTITPLGHTLVFRVPSEQGLQSGDAVAFEIDTARAHIFADGDFGPCLTIEHQPDGEPALA